MRPNRAMKRSEVKQSVKESKAKLKDLEKKVGSLKKSCIICEKSFDDNDKTLLDTWMIRAEADRVSLFCPKCFSDHLKTNQTEDVDS